jgi:hypothetical protein
VQQALALWLGKVQKRRFAKTDNQRGARAARARLRQPVRKREHIPNYPSNLLDRFSERTRPETRIEFAMRREGDTPRVVNVLERAMT